MPDVGLTHIALPVSDMDRSVAFYERYAGMQVVHRRPRATDPARDVVWLSDRTRPFAIVLVDMGEVERALGPFAHLGVATEMREDVDRLAAMARDEGLTVAGPRDAGAVVGYYCMIQDPDDHTLELSYGQDVGSAVEGQGAR